YLRKPKSPERTRILVLLTRHGPDPETFVPLLIDISVQDDEDANQAANALLAVDPEGTKAIPTLLPLLDDPKEAVARRTLTTLVRFNIPKDNTKERQQVRAKFTALLGNLDCPPWMHAPLYSWLLKDGQTNRDALYQALKPRMDKADRPAEQREFHAQV